MTILIAVMGVCILFLTAAAALRIRIHRYVREDQCHRAFTDELNPEKTKLWLAEEVFQRQKYGIKLMSDSMFNLLAKHEFKKPEGKKLGSQSYNYNVLCDARYQKSLGYGDMHARLDTESDETKVILNLLYGSYRQVNLGI